MKSRYGSLVLLVFLLFAGVTLRAQFKGIPNASAQAQARKVLSSQGVDEAELKQRLQQKGLDVDNMSADQLIASRPTIEATVAEMKAEQNQDAKSAKLAEAESQVVEEGLEKAKRIREAVEDGASIEEAAAEADVEEMGEDDSSISRIYGHSIFRDKTLDVYRGSEQARAPNSYILDSGDELAISIFGSSQVDLILPITDDGFLKPTGIPRILLRGRTLGEAKKLVKSRLSNYYVFSEGQFSMSLDAARTISVSVYGEVERSGTYTLSALNGALNALVASGGVTDRGSVRNIEIIREGVSKKIDVYNFLENPSEGVGYGLRDNDIIKVPVATKIIDLRGAVRRPMRYEIQENEKLSALVAYAGGLTSRAASNATRVVRYGSGSLSVIDVDFNTYQRFELVDGDVVEIPVVESPIENFVTIEGSVLISGRFGFRENLTLNEVLNRAQLRPTARKDVAFLNRKNEDGTTSLQRLDLTTQTTRATKLMRGDVITILASSRFVDNATFSVEGAVRDSSRQLPFPTNGGVSLSEAILLAGGLKANVVEEALVIRTPLYNKEERVYIRIQLNSADTFQIKPFDRIVLYRQERFADAPLVKISGAVRNPGEFRYDESLNLNDLIYLAGGIRFDASLDRVEVYRLVLKGNETRTLQETVSLDETGTYSGDFDLLPNDEIIVRRSANFENIETVELRGEVLYPGFYARKEGENKISDFISRAGGLTKEAFPEGAGLYRPSSEIGHVVIGLNKIIENPRIPANMVLKQGDVLSIPKPQELVRIETSGTLANQFGIDSLTRDGIIEVAYQGPHTAEWYIERYAGGFDNKKAKQKWTTVEYASGQIKETKVRIGLLHYPIVESGSTIRAGLKPYKTPKKPRERTSWGEVAQATLAGVTALVTLVVLITR